MFKIYSGSLGGLESLNRANTVSVAFFSQFKEPTCDSSSRIVRDVWKNALHFPVKHLAIDLVSFCPHLLMHTISKSIME